MNVQILAPEKSTWGSSSMKRRVQDTAVSTIIFDCDDVLLDWQEGFRLWMLATNGVRLDPAGPQSWDMDEWIGEPALPFIERFNASSSFGDLRSCMGAKAAVAQLYAAGHELHVVTACSADPAIIFRRERNLDRVFGDVFASIVCVPLGFPKSEALSKIAESTSQPIIWIEDNHKNALAGRALGFDCWMMRRPHNLSHEAFSPLDMKWADDFDPILERLFPATAVA
ncbi:phosphatase [Rhodobacter phage RcRios]|nr:phosphatase [Rhodobacter phage RcRios]